MTTSILTAYDHHTGKRRQLERNRNLPRYLEDAIDLGSYSKEVPQEGGRVETLRTCTISVAGLSSTATECIRAGTPNAGVLVGPSDWKIS